MSYLLAEYLYRNGIETIWYSAQRGDWSHAWLVVKDATLGPGPIKNGITIDFTDIYLDYGTFVLDSDGKDYEKKDWRSGADYNRGDLCVDLI